MNRTVIRAFGLTWVIKEGDAKGAADVLEMLVFAGAWNVTWARA